MITCFYFVITAGWKTLFKNAKTIQNIVCISITTWFAEVTYSKPTFYSYTIAYSLALIRVNFQVIRKRSYNLASWSIYHEKVVYFGK